METRDRQSSSRRVLAIIVAVALAGGSMVGVAGALFGGNDQPAGGNQPASETARPQPTKLEGSIPVEFAVVEESTDGPCENTEGRQTRTEPVRCLHTGEELTVDRIDAATAFPLEDTGQAYAVVLTLLDEDAGALKEFTSEHVGDEIAIGTGGEVLLAPRLDQPIEDGMLTITDPGLGREGALELARRFTG